MKILGKYVGRELSWGIILTLLSLVAISYFVTFAAEMGNIGQQEYTSTTAALYVLMKMPKIVQEMLPVATLIGALFAFGGLASSSELTVMRATGNSLLGMLWRVRKVGIVLIVLAIINMEWVVPSAERSAHILKALALHESVVEYSGDAFWLRDGEHFVRMEHVGSDGSVFGLQWMAIPQHGELSEVNYASRGKHDGSGWFMEDVDTTTIIQGTASTDLQITTVSKDSVQHPSTVSQGLIRLASRTPEDLSTVELLRYSAYLSSNGLDSGSYWNAFWGRIAMPFSIIVMLVLALPFSLSEGRSVAVGKRVVIGIFIGVGFYIINKVLIGGGEVYGFNPVLTAFSIPLLFFIIAIALIRKRGL